MKKITKLSFILLIILAIVGSTVYAALDCTVSLQTNKTEFDKDEEVVVEVNISDIQSEKGVIAFGATIEYDKDSLTLVKMEGKNNWSTPSYNEANGKIVTDRSGVTTSNETVFQITFKIKEQSKQNLTVTLKDITIADGTSPIKKIEAISKNIIIKEETSDPTPDTEPNPTPNPDTSSGSDSNTDNEQEPSQGSDNQNTGNSNGNTNSNPGTSSGANSNTGTEQKPSQGSNNQNTGNSNGNTNLVQNLSSNTDKNEVKEDNSIKKGTLPQTGNTNVIFIIVTIIAVALVVIFYIKIRRVNNKIKNEIN